MTTPSPSMMQRFAPKTTTVTAVAAELAPGQSGRLRLGTVPHDGVIKAKQAQNGQTVRAWLTVRGVPQAVGGERVVDQVSPVDVDGNVTISFSTPHPTTVYKAAYRFYVEALVGTPTRGMVAYEEV